MVSPFRFLFQSLFYWKYLSDSNHIAHYEIALLVFQSLFYWKYLSDIQCTTVILPAIVFQSLFYWKYLSDFYLVIGSYCNLKIIRELSGQRKIYPFFFKTGAISMYTCSCCAVSCSTF